MPIYKGKARRLDDIDLPSIGSQIGVGEDVVHALIEVETRGTGFDSQGRVIILFEPHKFYANLRSKPEKRAEAVRQGLAYPKWGQKKYPKDSYPRLIAAMEIDETAALRSCSWGMGQVMGDNFKDLGYDTVQEMVQAFADDEEAHLQGMIDFIKANHIDDDLRRIEQKTKRGQKVTAADWIPVVRVYNGSGYAKNQYDTRAAAAYNKWLKIKDTPFGKDGEKRASVKEMAAIEEIQNAPEDLIADTDEDIETPITHEVETHSAPEPEEARQQTKQEEPPPSPPKPVTKDDNDPNKRWIPAIPPIPVNVPMIVKGTGAVMTALSLVFTTAAGFYKDHPTVFFALVGLAALFILGLTVLGVVTIWKLFDLRKVSMQEANKLNTLRYENHSDQTKPDVDFSGWKTPPTGVNQGAQV